MVFPPRGPFLLITSTCIYVPGDGLIVLVRSTFPLPLCADFGIVSSLPFDYFRPIPRDLQGIRAVVRKKSANCHLLCGYASETHTAMLDGDVKTEGIDVASSFPI